MKLPNLRSSDLMVSRITRQELPALTAFCVTCSAFFELVEGKPGSHAVASARAHRRSSSSSVKQRLQVLAARILVARPSPLDRS
jgi:hypothetical protein